MTPQTSKTDSETGVREAFGHLKAIGTTGEAVNLVKTACEVDGMNFSAAGSHDVVESYGVVTAGAAKPESFKETINMAKGAKDFIDIYISTSLNTETLIVGWTDCLIWSLIR